MVAVPRDSLYLQRTFYFNMVQGRSYWELPDELKAQVMRPATESLRMQDPAFYAHGSVHSANDRETQRRREEVMQYAANANANASIVGVTTLQERMAQAAQRKKVVEMKKFTAEKQREGEKSDVVQVSGSNEYLKMVRQLQHVDKETESTGGKWLVR